MIKRVLNKIIHIWKIIPADRMYLIFLLIGGCICLTVTGSWDYYTDPVKDGGTLLLTKLGVELPEKEEGWFVASKEESQETSSEEEPVTEEIETGESKEVPEESEEVEASEEPEEEDETGTEFEGVVFTSVGEDYFNDAVFIGDSRTVGLCEYSSLKENSTFYASVGLSVHKLFTAKIVEVPGQHNKITVEQALSENRYEKVYFMLGINEMGIGTPESFLQKYKECVDKIRELQPDAIIYLQGIMQVTETRSAKGDSITNEGIVIRNEGIKAMADDETIFYLEINEALCDENGALISEYTGDGVHLKAKYIDLWKEYLKSHAVVRE